MEYSPASRQLGGSNFEQQPGLHGNSVVSNGGSLSFSKFLSNSPDTDLP